MRLFLILIVLFGKSLNILGSTTTRYTQIKSIHEVAGDILYDNEDFWLIFDVDDTLFQGAEALTHTLWLQNTIEGFQQLGLTEQKAWETVLPYWIEIQEMGSVKSIEVAMNTLIKKIQAQGKTLFAYTERPRRTKDLTLKQLESLDIFVSKTAPQANTLPEQLAYHSGVLFAEEYHKGLGLQLFLDALDFSPKKIIYIDNLEENVLRVGDLCVNRGIHYFGITYSAQKYLPPIYLPEISKIQYTFSKKLLSNEAAALLLRHQLHK
ncbi:DUF2608 domain-containing protein [Chlamydia sp. 17-3921]|uniref:DUF2608 domain-containing protein n=1 Tax=Chlamydia sp. 17-3921 TaxID=2675798 RepID=UPI00191A1246|nr:DUF2608 domain-containing protein [Chlamydia sp. 17-3921]